MKTLYFDCFSGISGDMTLAAFLDLGVPLEYLKTELAKLPLDGYHLVVSEVEKNGILAKKVDVVVQQQDHAHHHAHHEGDTHHHTHHEDHAHHHTHHEGDVHHHAHRSFLDIEAMIASSSLPQAVKQTATDIFWRLAQAEGKVHGKPPKQVGFHEVGAVDSIVDIVATAICVHFLNPDRIVCSPMVDGRGFVHCQHGMIPVPVPATSEVFAQRGVPLQLCQLEQEMITPTGAAIVTQLADEFCANVLLTPTKIGYGAGSKDFKDRPNVLRLILSEESKQADAVYQLQTNIDDSTPEVLGYTMERLLENGALDVFHTPILMKKNRPATMLTVLCHDVETMERILFEETSTIGIRRSKLERTVLPREMVQVQTPYGKVQAKSVTVGTQRKLFPEYDDVAALSKKNNIPFQTLYDLAAKEPFF